MTAPTFTDASGLIITTRSADAATRYARGVSHLLAASPTAESALRDAVRSDPWLGLAWIALALACEPATADVGQCSAAAVAVSSVASRRERQHIEVIRLMLVGNSRRAEVLGREHLREHPADVVVRYALGSHGLC